MTLTRRAALAAATAAALPGVGAAQAKTPLIIAHRGASGERPEHTLAAYRLAITQGADYVEPDLVASSDGILICRHETNLAGTTNVAAVPRYAARSRGTVVEGREVVGWYAEDFTSAEIATLRARERLPDLRPASARFDGQEPPPTFQQVVELVKFQAGLAGRPVGLYPELKSPGELLAKGLDIGGLLVDALNRAGLPNAEVPVFIQSFEQPALRRLKNRTKAKLIQLVQLRTLLTYQGLADIATYAAGVGIEKSLLTPTVVANAHAAGLMVHAWTFRPENAFLPEDLRKGSDRAAHGDMTAEIKRYLAMGVDGVFSDFPGLARAAVG